ncbi:MAG: hypothetical protein ACLFQ7_17715 [Phormidium sp.]
MRFPHPLTTVMSVAIALGWFGGLGRLPKAMGQYAPCAPPDAGQFLVLVLPEGNDDLAVVGSLLPSRFQAQPCTYLDEVVLRIQGFSGQDEASALARSITEEAGLNAFVTRPPSNGNTASSSSQPSRSSSSALNLPQVQIIEARPAGGRSSSATSTDNRTEAEESESTSASTPATSNRRDRGNESSDLDISLGDLPPANLPDGSFDVPAPDGDREDLPVYIPVEDEAAPVSPNNAPEAQPLPQIAVTSPARGYNPQPLEEGYAVLVDYFNQPQVASELQRVTNRTVGLVSYGQRPYLLVGYSRDETEANELLQRLSERGFWTMVVDSQRVMLLTPQVSLN